METDKYVKELEGKLARMSDEELGEYLESVKAPRIHKIKLTWKTFTTGISLIHKDSFASSVLMIALTFIFCGAIALIASPLILLGICFLLNGCFLGWLAWREVHE